MSNEKGIVSKEETFDKLEIRLGRVVSIEEITSASKKAYKMKVDFGKFGIKTSIGRFTQHSPEEILDKLVLGILNFEPRQIGDTISEVLILGVQYPRECTEKINGSIRDYFLSRNRVQIMGSY